VAIYALDASGTPQPSSDTSMISNPCPNNRTLGEEGRGKEEKRKKNCFKNCITV
jgi:hypothetical protein